MKRLSLIVVVLAIALTALASAALASSKTVYRADLGGASSAGHGNAVFQLTEDGSQLKYHLIVNNLNNTTQAHIHVAATPGANGPVALWLAPDGPPAVLIPGIFNGMLGARTVTSADLVGPLAGRTLLDLETAIQEGRAYVNVHTTLFPAGEIRGDID